MDKIYLVKDIAGITGLSIYTVKYYLKLGLIEEIGRSPDTNFRYFDDTTISRLLEIRKFRKRGMSIKEIRAKISGGA